MTRMKRKIVRIDEEKCNGCGDCIPSCAEGALRIVNGKARLVADKLCDGLGACLGNCPLGAINIEEREADDFDEQAVEAHLQAGNTPVACPPRAAPAAMVPAATSASILGSHQQHHHGGCPGSRLRVWQPQRPAAPAPSDDSTSPRPSRLGQWPVQLALVPTSGPMWQNGKVLIAADCVPFAYPDFHEKMLADHGLAIACPKLDDVRPYVHKLAMIFASNPIHSVTVAHMEVPCCTGIVRVVQMALAQSGREDIELNDITVGIDGSIRKAG